MHKVRRYIILVLFFALLLAMGFGFYLKQNGDNLNGDRVVGLSIMAGVFVLMPLFIYHRWKDRKVKDYMLTENSIKRMREYNDKKES